MESVKKIEVLWSARQNWSAWRDFARNALGLGMKNILVRSSLACLVAVSLPAVAAQRDNPQAVTFADRGVLAAEVLETWADFRIPVDANNSTPWGYVDLRAWVKAAITEQLLAARMATTFDGVVKALRPSASKTTGAVALAAGQPVTTNALGNLASDLVYTPITPCRIIDTRASVAGIIGANNGQQFYVSSANYSSQGGQAASCGIPANVSAVAINVVSTGQTGPGHLRVIESGGGIPTVSFLNYQWGVNLANAGISRVGTYLSNTGIFIYSANSASHAVVDIMGYFSSPGSQQAVSTEGAPGSLTLSNSPVICQVSLTPTQNWTARPTGAVSLLADSAGSLGWASNFVYSTDAGLSWFTPAGIFIRGGAPASTWGYSSTNPVDALSLASGTSYLFGIQVFRYSGSGNATDSRCALRVALE